MKGWTLSINGSEVMPAQQVTEIKREDLEWLDDNLLPVVVPVKGVGVEFIKNAVYGIPDSCPVIFVSATEDEEARGQEKSFVHQFHGNQERDVLWIPQQNSDVKTFLEENYPALVEDGEVVPGYREALLIGSFTVKSLGADYMAVVDGDNWNPMAIREFVTLYARGFRQGADYVSLEWRCKPKCGDDGFEWRDEGRTSSVANEMMSRAVMFSSDHQQLGLISSSCSGDHAVTMDLWDELDHTENHSGEVGAFVQILEGEPEADLAQFKTMSPMFHQYGDGEHIQQERAEVLRELYHSDLVDDQLRERIVEKANESVKEENRVYPSTGEVDSGFLPRLEQLKP